MNRLQSLKERQNKSEQSVYTRTEQDREVRQFGWFKLILFILFTFGAGYIVFGSDFFRIKNIDVEGYSHPDTIKGIAGEMVEKNFLSKNIFLFNLRELEETLSGDARIVEVKVERKFPNKILIVVKESSAALIWDSAGERYLIDDRGVVMNLAGDEKLPVVSDAANIKIAPGKRVASPIFIKFINKINRDFRAVAGGDISKIIILDVLTDVHVLSSQGFVVYFDSSRSAESQLTNLGRILSEAQKDGTKLQYVDMRLDSKIYYK